MNIIQLITAFGGGMLGAAIGGVPAFVFTGLTVIIAIFAGESGMPVIGTLSFGSVFGPHVAFGGAVAAAALAKKKGLVENGQDLSVPLFSTGDSSVLLVGGVFGIVGFVIQYIYRYRCTYRVYIRSDCACLIYGFWYFRELYRE